MFTGIVEEVGTVAERSGAGLRICAQLVVGDARVGDSIAVNGCCLTVVELHRDERPDLSWWDADVSEETLRRTNLGALRPGDTVNLERPVRLQDRLGGHLVQGHVDGIGTIVVPAPHLDVRVEPALTRYIVEKGSITVDGISLTVVEVLDDGFTVAIIPHTESATTLSTKRAGDPVNIEVDVTAKYIERLIGWHDPR